MRIEVYGIDGRLVRRLVDREYGVGRHTAVFDGRDQAGRPDQVQSRVEAQSDRLLRHQPGAHALQADVPPQGRVSHFDPRPVLGLI